MKITKERKNYLRYRDLRKSYKQLQENLLDLPLLFNLVAPARVRHARHANITGSPTLYGFAKSHDYNYSRLLKLLRRENVLFKVIGTWIWTDDYRNKDFAFYTVGRTHRYNCLDMHLLPAGIRFLEDFLITHSATA